MANRQFNCGQFVLWEDVLLWAIAQHKDPPWEAIVGRWRVSRATGFRWHVRLAAFRHKFLLQQRGLRP
jgi:hypothetical protein